MRRAHQSGQCEVRICRGNCSQRMIKSRRTLDEQQGLLCTANDGKEQKQRRFRGQTQSTISTSSSSACAYSDAPCDDHAETSKSYQKRGGERVTQKHLIASGPSTASAAMCRATIIPKFRTAVACGCGAYSCCTQAFSIEFV